MNRRLAGRVGVGLGAVMLAGLGFTAPAAAATHAVTVTPSTGLADGQVVQVTGTGFTETPLTNDWAVTQCRAAVLTPPLTLDLALANCDATTMPFVFAHADAAGNFSASFAVRTVFTPTSGGGGSVDCRVSPCVILVGQITSPGISFSGAGAPISFGTPPPPPPPPPPPRHCTGPDRPGHGYGDRNHCHQHSRQQRHDRRHHGRR